MVIGAFENACSGTVNIQDTATVNIAQGIYVGHVGAGTFNQSGGTVTKAGGPSFRVGSDPGSSGTPILTGGVLQINGLSQGSGTALFNFGGGTIQALAGFSSSLPMTLTGTGGNATVDTSGYTVTLSGPLSGTSSAGGLLNLLRQER